MITAPWQDLSLTSISIPTDAAAALRKVLEA